MSIIVFHVHPTEFLKELTSSSSTQPMKNPISPSQRQRHTTRPPPPHSVLFRVRICVFQSTPPPPFSAKVRCVKSIRLDLFLLYTSLFQHPPPPPFSAKVRCVKSIRVDLFLLLRKGHFGNTHAVRPFSEWGGGGPGHTVRGVGVLKANDMCSCDNCLTQLI